MSATIESSVITKESILAQSDFDFDPFGARPPKLDGWSHQGDCTLTRSATDGNPGGCLKAVDAVTGNVFYYVAPAKFLGDKQSAVQLEYDIKWEANTTLPIFPWEGEVELAGGGMTLIYNPGPPARNSWSHCVVPLKPSAFWKNKTANRLATDSDFKIVLGSLTKLAIRGEFAHGGPEIGYLDNVVMCKITGERRAVVRAS